RELARALAYIHALRDGEGAPRRLIHRDVSPSNVMISRDAAIKLVDFGIAKSLDELDPATRIGLVRGKLGYVAPEQERGLPLDQRVDLFAAGVVLHEALTGRRLFPNGNTAGAPAEPPSRSRPEVPPELDRICMRALERDRERRYRSAEEMGADLD